jgi:hypothetical protein
MLRLVDHQQKNQYHKEEKNSGVDAYPLALRENPTNQSSEFWSW